MKIKPFRLPFGTTTESVARGDHTHPELGGPGEFIFKEESEARNSTTTVAEDSALIAALNAGARYLVRGIIYLRAENATMDVKYDLSYSGGLSSREVGVQKHLVPGSSTEQIVLS
jgi:hypothetical protein